MKHKFRCYCLSYIAVVLNILSGVSKAEAQTGCASKPDGSQPTIAIPPSQVISGSNSRFPVQRLSEKISDILVNGHCFQVIDPNTVIARLRSVEPYIQDGIIDPANAARDGEVLGSDFFFQTKVLSIDEKWNRRNVVFRGIDPNNYTYSFRIEFRVEILCIKGTYGYSHIETVEFEKNVRANGEVPDNKNVKIDEMLQLQCKLLQENLAAILVQCDRDSDPKPKPKPPVPRLETSVQVKLTSINYDQYTAIDSCLKRHSDAVTIVNDNSFRNNQGHIDVKFKGDPQALVDIVRGCVNLRVAGVQSNLIELSGQ